MTTLILFGAGASYGSGYTGKRRSKNQVETPKGKTPLGNELFDELVKDFPDSWGKINEDLKQSFKDKGFEAGMKNLLKEEVANQRMILQGDMAKYFSRFKILDPKNLYFRLFKEIHVQIKKGTIRIATPNYECLIEQALDLCNFKNIKFKNINHTKPPYLYKIHGSCHFIPERGRMVGWASNKLSNGKITIKGNGKFNFTIFPESLSNIEEIIEEECCLVSMSAFCEGKPTSTSEPYIAEIRAEYEKFARSANKIIVIGAKFIEADEHIWQSLFYSKEFIYIGDQDSSDKISSRIDKNTKYSYLGGDFKKSFDDLKIHLVNQMKP